MTDDQAARICYRFGPFVLDTRRLLLRRDDDVIQLPQKAFDVLVVLVEQRSELVTKDDLLARVWPQTVVEENNLPRQISTLRKALGDTREHHEFIATIPGQGYRFVAPVERVTSTDADRPAPSAPSAPSAPIEFVRQAEFHTPPPRSGVRLTSRLRVASVPKDVHAA